jgi:hypothetical protein
MKAPAGDPAAAVRPGKTGGHPPAHGIGLKNRENARYPFIGQDDRQHKPVKTAAP